MTVLEQEAPVADLSVTLRMPDDTRAILTRNAGAVELANAFVIDSQDMADEAVSQIRAWRTTSGRLDALYKGFVEPATKIIENARGLFNPARNAIEAADKILRTKLTAWQQEQERVAEENRQAAIRKEREARAAADREAEAARAAAAARADALRREQEEQLRLQREAAAANDTKAAVEAATRAAKAAADAHAVVERAEAKATTAILEAATTVVVAPPPVRSAGLGTRDNWVAELEADEASTVRKLVAEICAHPERTDLFAYLSVNLKAGTATAKALKGQFNVPGMVAKNKASSVIR